MKRISPQLTHARLLEVLRYEPHTGKCFWRVRGAHRRNPGDEAGCPSKDGRIRNRIDGHLHYRYRLAWFYVTGDWPLLNIDHRNGNPVDDRWGNLRDVSQSVNLQNIRVAPRHSSTGLLGAHRMRCGRFTSQITVNSRGRYLGIFATPEQAHAAYMAAKRTLHISSST